MCAVLILPVRRAKTGETGSFAIGSGAGLCCKRAVAILSHLPKLHNGRSVCFSYSRLSTILTLERELRQMEPVLNAWRVTYTKGPQLDIWLRNPPIESIVTFLLISKTMNRKMKMGRRYNFLVTTSEELSRIMLWGSSAELSYNSTIKGKPVEKNALLNSEEEEERLEEDAKSMR